MLHLLLQYFGLHDRIQQYHISPLQSSQHIQSFHQVGHTDKIIPVGFSLAGFQKFLMQNPVGMLRVEYNLIIKVRVGMYPDRIFTSFKNSAQDCSQRAGSQLSICNREHIRHQTTVSDIPIQIFRPPLRIKPLLRQVFCRGRRSNVRMRFHTFLKVFPHRENNSFMIPPVYITLLSLF